MITSPIVLAILDGWGLTRNTRGNAIFDAYTPTIDRIASLHPSLVLQASGFSVGMLWGEAGNSEAGHMAIGTGRITYHHLPRILKEIRTGSFFENPVLIGAIAHVKKHHGKLHLVGTLSGAAVHSYLDHLLALFTLAQNYDTACLLHIITDGKDAPPRQGIRILEHVLTRITTGAVSVTPSTLLGRHYLMDAALPEERILQGYRVLVAGETAEVPDALACLRAAYERGVTDEFVPPIVLRAGTRIRPNDAVICFNFREDGLKQFVKILAGAETLSPQEPPPPQNVYIATFTRYATDVNVGVAFPAEETRQSLSEALSAYGVQQVKIAEVKKVAHVSYFFNGGREESFPFESRIVIPSPTEADASTAPSDTAAIATGEEVVRLVERTAAECIVANFATADHALHTGNFKATIRAVEAVDRALERVYQTIVHRRGALLITADHGGAEEMFNIRTGEIKSGHSDNPVPLYYVTGRNRFRAARDEKELVLRYTQPVGVLADIAPTILQLLGVKKPAEMTGRSLLGLL